MVITRIVHELYEARDDEDQLKESLPEPDYRSEPRDEEGLDVLLIMFNSQKTEAWVSLSEDSGEMVIWWSDPIS